MPDRPLIVGVIAILGLAAAILYGLFAWGLWREVENARSFVFAALALAVVAILHLVAGHGLWHLRPHGRVLHLAFAWIGVFGVPCGPPVSIMVIVTPRRAKPTMRTATPAGDNAGIAVP